ncbi:MAG: Crp/Fnr family transcriptional regulator [Dehalococcoidia bacterium]
MPAERSPEQLLSGVPFLVRLLPDDRKALAARARPKSFASGTVIFNEGEAGDALYVVVEGHARIVVSNGAGEETTVAVINAGDVIGDQALLDGGRRSATAVAGTLTKTLTVTREAFLEWLVERPTAARVIIETLSQRLRRMNQQHLDMVSLELAQRLAKLLLTLATNYDLTPQASPASLRLQFTQADLASMLGVSRESVNKQLNTFSRDGLVAISRGAVTIKDVAGLRAHE